MSDEAIRSTDAPDLTRLSDEQLCRRYVERNDLARELYVRWLIAPDFSRYSDRLMAVSRPIRNEVQRCHGEIVARGLRIDVSIRSVA